MILHTCYLMPCDGICFFDLATTNDNFTSCYKYGKKISNIMRRLISGRHPVVKLCQVVHGALLNSRLHLKGKGLVDDMMTCYK